MNISKEMTREEKEEFEFRYEDLKSQIWVLKYLKGNEHERVRQYLEESFREIGLTKEQIFSMIPPRP